jgi:hypothetical protein
LTGQSPITQFENYPRTSPESASGPVPDALTTPRQPTATPSPVDTRKLGWNLSSRSVSRRSALGWLVGIPVVAVIGIEVFARHSDLTVGQDVDPFEAAVFAAAPADWDLTGDSRGWVIQHGSNEVRAVVLEDQSGEDATIMSEALAALQPSVKVNPTKAAGRTVAGSPAIEVRGSGSVHGKKARQIVDVFVDTDTRRALAISQLLTADPKSALVADAQGFVANLVGAWPW